MIPWEDVWKEFNKITDKKYRDWGGKYGQKKLIEKLVNAAIVKKLKEDWQ